MINFEALNLQLLILTKSNKRGEIILKFSITNEAVNFFQVNATIK